MTSLNVIVRAMAFIYNAAGRLGSSTLTTPSSTETGTYDDQDRMTSYAGCTYAYTANGELTTKTCGSEITSYTYDDFGNLTHVVMPDGITIDYVIDARNRRVGKKVNGTLVEGYLYGDQLNPVAELDGSGNVVARFVYGTKPNVPDSMVKGGVTYRYITDQLGSVRLVVDAATGAIAQRIDYDEYGVTIQDTNPGFQPFGFAGGITDGHTGLVRFGARDYDPASGRWTSKDPVGFLGFSPGLYEYLSSEPVNGVDRDGRGWQPSGAAVRNYSSCPVQAWGEKGPGEEGGPLEIPRGRVVVFGHALSPAHLPPWYDVDFVCLKGVWWKIMGPVDITRNRNLNALSSSFFRKANAGERAHLPPCRTPRCNG